MKERPLNFNPNPPDDNICRECFEWRRYPKGQEHFGYNWWLVCDWKTCPHLETHHKDEIWVGEVGIASD